MGYTANAATITFNLDIAFSGTPPGGSAPWLTATFDDGGTPGAVVLTMSASGLIASEFVGGGPQGQGWLFNFNTDDFSLADLEFSYNAVASTGPAADVTTAINGYKPDGDGFFDIKFEFPTANNEDRFGAGEVVVYNITSTTDPIEPIVADSFNLFSSSIGGDNKGAGGQGLFLSSAHVQGIYNEQNPDNANSGWVGAVPIPSAMWLFGSGLLGLIAIRRRKN
jgi:hypothetical protein